MLYVRSAPAQSVLIFSVDEASLLEAGIHSVPYNDMIQHLYPENVTAFHEASRHPQVFIGGRRVPRGVIVCEAYRSRTLSDGRRKAFPRMHRST